MFTKLGASGNFGSGFAKGTKVKGTVSGATGITAEMFQVEQQYYYIVL